MDRVIALDLSRLFLGPLFLAPRGIDRIDLALAQHVFADPASPNLAIVPTPWGVRAFPAHFARKIITHVEELWVETTPDACGPHDEPALRRLIARMTFGSALSIDGSYGTRRLRLWDKVYRMVQELRAIGFMSGRSAADGVPPGAVYLNVGQLGLAVPMFFTWLHRRPDVTCAMMLHDVIPLEYPSLVRPGQVDHHDQMVRTAASHADHLIFTTAHARDTVCAKLERHGRLHVPSFTRALPLSSAFTKVSMSPQGLTDKSYFIVVSTVERRKNHTMILRIWQRLVKRMGEQAPHLVIVGSRGFDADRILEPLETDPLLASHVHLVSGLSSPSLAALMLGATGLLSPSRAEGFGLPVLEANALGVPTIASNIAAHCEVANESTVLLGVDDEEGWESAILSLPQVGHRVRPAISEALTEAAYCRDLLGYLADKTYTVRGTVSPPRMRAPVAAAAP